MTIGTDLEEVLDEVGAAYTILRDSGNITGEYLDAETNAQVTKPFIREFFLEASLGHNTEAVNGDYLQFNITSDIYMVMNKTAEIFENSIIAYQVVLYKCNVSDGLILRPTNPDWDSDYYRRTVWSTVKANAIFLLTSHLMGGELEELDLGEITLHQNEMIIPTSIGVQIMDRVKISDTEYYKVSSVKKRRFKDVDVLEVIEDVRPVTTTTTTSTTTTTTSTTTSSSTTSSSFTSTTTSSVTTSSTSSSTTTTTA